LVARVFTWVVPLGAAAAFAAIDFHDPGDLPLFVKAGQTLLSSHWAETFADPVLQAGPLLFAYLGVGRALSLLLGFPPLAFLAVLIEVTLTALLLFVAGRLFVSYRYAKHAQLLVALAAIGFGVMGAAYDLGHPAQVAIPLLWILAGLEAARDRVGRAGLFLAIAAGIETWGALGAPLLLMAPNPRRALAGLAVQAVVRAGLFLPFVLAGHFRMLEYRWSIEPWTPLSWLLGAGHHFPWSLRLVQGLAAVIGGAAVVLLLRRRRVAVLAAPVAVVAIRLVLDPAIYAWYWLPIETIGLLAAGLLANEFLVDRKFSRLLHSPADAV
jgi:hypothetical protein